MSRCFNIEFLHVFSRNTICKIFRLVEHEEHRPSVQTTSVEHVKYKCNETSTCMCDILPDSNQNQTRALSKTHQKACSIKLKTVNMLTTALSPVSSKHSPKNHSKFICKCMFCCSAAKIRIHTINNDPDTTMHELMALERLFIWSSGKQWKIIKGNIHFHHQIHLSRFLLKSDYPTGLLLYPTLNWWYQGNSAKQFLKQLGDRF